MTHWDAHAKALFDPQTGLFRNCSAMHGRRRLLRVRDVAQIESEVCADAKLIETTQTNTPYW